MPKLLEELQFPSMSEQPTPPKYGFSLYNANGVLKILHADGTEKIVATGNMDDFEVDINFDNYYTKAEVDSFLSGLGPSGFEVIILETSTLPTTGEKDKMYLLPNGNTYIEYLYVDNKWESIGTTSVDLSDYYTKSQTNTEITNTVTSTVNNKLGNYYTKEEVENQFSDVNGKVIFRTWTEV